MLGLDVLIDEDYKCWLMEINANPSLNVFSEKEGNNGEIEQQLSEIDKYVKTKLVADTIDLLKTAALFDIYRKQYLPQPVSTLISLSLISLICKIPSFLCKASLL